MTALRLRNLLLLPLVVPCLLAACGTVRLQSLSQMTHQVSEANYHGDRRACDKHADSTVYRECLRRTDEAYEAWRAERAKIDNNR